MVDILTQRARTDVRGRFRALDVRIGDEARDVQLVGLAGFYGRALLQRKEIVEALNTKRACYCIVDRCATHPWLDVVSTARKLARARPVQLRWRRRPSPIERGISRPGPSYRRPGMPET